MENLGVKTSNYIDIVSEIVDPLYTLPVEETVSGFASFSYLVIKELKNNFKPCDPIPENVFVFSKSVIKKATKVARLESSSTENFINVFSFFKERALSSILAGMFNRAMHRAVVNHKINPKTLVGLRLKTNGTIKVMTSNNKNFVLNMLTPHSTDIVTKLLNKTFEEFTDNDIKEGDTCNKCYKKCEKFLQYHPETITTQHEVYSQPTSIITIPVKQEIDMTIAQLVIDNKELILSYKSKGLQVAKFIQLILQNNDGHIPNLAEFSEQAKQLDLLNATYKYREFFNRSDDFNLTTGKFNVDYSTPELIQEWRLNQRRVRDIERKEEVTTVKQELLPVITGDVVAVSVIKDFVRNVENKINKIELEHAELLSCLISFKKLLGETNV